MATEEEVNEVERITDTFISSMEGKSNLLLVACFAVIAKTFIDNGHISTVKMAIDQMIRQVDSVK